MSILLHTSHWVPSPKQSSLADYVTNTPDWLMMLQVSLMTDSDSWQGPDVRGVPSSQLCNVPHYALSTRAALRAQCTVHITPLHTCGQITWVTGVGAQMQGAPDYLTQLYSGQLLSEQVSTATIRVQTSSHRMPELLELFRRWDQLFGLAVKLIFWIE